MRRHWSQSELQMLGTKTDSEIARLVDLSLLAIKGKKFQLRKARDENSTVGDMPKEIP